MLEIRVVVLGDLPRSIGISGWQIAVRLTMQCGPLSKSTKHSICYLKIKYFIRACTKT